MSKIEWTDVTWNPLRGCSRISPGCKNCYAERMAARHLPGWESPTTGQHFAVVGQSGPRWTGNVELIEKRLELPLTWKNPRRVFVNSTSDLFHDAVKAEWIFQIFDVMRRCPQHQFQVLTKRSKRMAMLADALPWQSNIWAGVSVESIEYTNRVEDLVTVPANRFVSYEPALGPVRFDRWADRLDWVIVGGESGPGARPFRLDWARCVPPKSIPLFVKQVGANAWWPCGKRQMKTKDRKGGDPSEWPEWLQRREFPAGLA